MNFVTQSLPHGDRDEPRVVEPLDGYSIVVAQINVALHDAKSWATQMTYAMEQGNEPVMQSAASAAATRAQTAHVLLRALEKQLAAHRHRRPHE